MIDNFAIDALFVTCRFDVSSLHDVYRRTFSYYFSTHFYFPQTLPRPSSFNHFINNALWVGFYKTDNISEDIKVRNLFIPCGARRRLLLGSITNRCTGN